MEKIHGTNVPPIVSPHIESLKKKLSRPLAHWMERRYEVEFQQLESHRSFMVGQLEKAQSSLKAEFIKIHDELDPADQSDYTEFMEDDFDLFENTFPMLQWQAQILVIYATFEDSLNGLCNVLQRRLKSRLSFKDMNGAGHERAKTYLSKVGGLDSVFGSDMWERARLLGKIRNAIAHHQGRIDNTNDARTVAALRKLNGLQLKPVAYSATEFKILLSSQFVKDSIITLQAIVHSIATHEREWPESPQQVPTAGSQSR